MYGLQAQNAVKTLFKRNTIANDCDLKYKLSQNKGLLLNFA
jgi:hypothetical protein